MILKHAIILMFLLNLGCGNKPDQKESGVDANSREAVAEKLDGYWLSNDYLVNVSNSRSVYKSKDYQTRFWGFMLSKSNLMTNSPNIGGFTEHEGGYTCPIKYDSTRNCFVNDLTHERYTAVREPFVMTVLTDGNIQLDFGDTKEEYRRVIDEQTELRRILFQGRFRNFETNATIEFSADGRTNGFGNKNYFELVYDFRGGFLYDLIIFYPSKDSSGIWSSGELFHFKIDNDTVKLYKITPDWERLEHTIGDLKYLLVKS